MMIYHLEKRRGNAIVLAASILVLLVIVATTFVSRTQTARKTASAVQRSSAANTSFDVTSLFLAQTVSDALFVRLIDAHYDPILGDEPTLTFSLPRADWSNTFSSQGVAAPALLQPRGIIRPLPTEVDTGDGPLMSRLAVPALNSGLNEVANPNRPRIPATKSGLSSEIGRLTSRFILESSASLTYREREVVEDDFTPSPSNPQPVAAAQALKLGRAGSWLKRYGVDPRFPANFAPYEVVPWTNWPDRPGYPWSPSNADQALLGFFLDGTNQNNSAPVFSGLARDKNGAYSPDHSLEFDGAGGLDVPIFADFAGQTLLPFSTGTQFHAVGEGNPLFGPGYGDTRWLRDLEPMSVDAFASNGGAPLAGPFPFAADGIPDSFRQWRHMSNVSSAENTWRVVFDISDVTGIRRTEGGFDQEDPINSVWPSLPIVSDLSVPIEQWLPNFPYGSIGYDFTGDLVENLPGARIGQTGTPRLLTSDYDFQGNLLEPTPFELSWSRWANRDLSPFDLSMRQSPPDDVRRGPPLNLYNLNDTNSDGIKGGAGEKYNDRFVGVRKSPSPDNWSPVPDNPNFPNGTAAWNINRYLDDADGDGFTDSFWFLPSSVPQNGVLQVVSVSITDNAGRIDLSSGSRFSPGLDVVPNPNNFDAPEQFAQSVRNRGTRGATPGDLALVSQLGDLPLEPDHPREGDSSNSNRNWIAESKVGFFDIPEHGEAWRQVPGNLNDGVLNTPPIGWPAVTSNSQPFEPFGQLTPPFQLSLVHQDYEGHYSGNTGSWANFLDVTQWGLFFDPTGNTEPSIEQGLDAFLTHEERLVGWRDGFGASSRRRLDLASELELRLIEGHNISDVYSQAEQLVGPWRHKTFNDEYGGAHPLRSVSVAVEQTPAFGGLTNGELRADLRHRSTTYSKTRNDLLPNWLRWKWDLAYDLDGDGILESPKLPSPLLEFENRWSLLINGDGSPYPLFGVDPGQINSEPGLEQWTEAYLTALGQFDRKVDLREGNPLVLTGTHFYGPRLSLVPTGNALLSRRLPYLVLNALADGDENGAWYGTWGPSGSSYFGFSRDVQPGFNGSVQPALANQYLSSGDPDFAQLDLSSTPGTEEIYKRRATGTYSPGHSRVNEHWLRLVSAGLSANILSYRDNDWIDLQVDPEDEGTWFPNYEPRLTGAIRPRFRDVAPIFPDERPDGEPVPGTDIPYSQQAGMIPLPEWDRSTVRDAADRYVDASTGLPSTLGINADPSVDPNLVVPVDGMLGIEMQPFLAEAAVVFVHATEQTNFDREACISANDAAQPCVALQRHIDATDFESFSKLVTCLSGEQFMESQRDLPYVTSESDHRAVVAVQLANPFDRPIPPEELAKYRISVHGMHVPLAECWLDDGTQQPDPGVVSPSLAPLEPVSSLRNPSAIFWLPPQDWSPRPDEVTPQEFRSNLANWMDIECWHDDSIQDELGLTGESPAPGSWWEGGNTSRWGLTGTNRYRVPERPLQGQGAPNPSGWSTNRCAYERIDKAPVITSDGQSVQLDPQTSFADVQLDLDRSQRVVELSRIDNSATLRLFPNLDQNDDGLVDLIEYNNPNCVWVVVDRFDLGIETDETASRILSSANPKPSDLEPVPVSGPLDGSQPIYNSPGGLKSNQFANGINPFLSDNQRAVVGPKPVFLVDQNSQPNGGGGPGGGPIAGGLQNFAFPRAGTDSGEGSGPGSPTDTTGSKNLFDADELEMIYYPGIFPPHWEPAEQGDTDNPSTNPWQSTNTFLQAFGVRRGWLLDMDYEENNPRTYGVQPSEFSLQFLSANQASTRLSGECRLFPYTSDISNFVAEGIVRQYPLSCNLSYPAPPLGQAYEFIAGQLPSSFYADSFDRQSAANANWIVNGTFIDAGNRELIEPNDPAGVDPDADANPSYWASDFTFLDESGNRLPPSSLIAQPQLTKYLKPFSFDGERRAHLYFRNSTADGIGRPFVYSKSLPNSFSYNGFSDLRASSLGLTFHQKDADFDQVGEIFNIPLVGHYVRYLPPPEVPAPRDIPTVQTIRTYSEFIAGVDPQRDATGGGRPVNPTGTTPANQSVLQEDDTRARLLAGTSATARLGLGRIIGTPEPLTLPGGSTRRSRSASDFADPRHAEPELPAAARLVELFTCDGPGFNHDNQVYFVDSSLQGDRYDLSRGFSERGTKGLLNVNTASVEALRAVPNWYKAIGVDAYTNAYSSPDSTGLERFPRTWQAETVASFRDGYSGFHTHGLPISRPFFDLRSSITSTLPPIRSGQPTSGLNQSDLDAHIFGYGRPELARAPDPTFPGLYANRIADSISSPMTDPFSLQPAPTNNGRGIQSLGMIRHIDHRRTRPNPGVGPDGLYLSRSDQNGELPLGWSDVFFQGSGPSGYADIEATMSDHHFDSESFSTNYFGNTSTGSTPHWPYRERVRRQSTRILVGSPPTRALQPTRLEGASTQSGYLSPFEKADHVLEGQPIQPSITSPVDVAGNGLPFVLESNGSTLLSQDSAGGDLEDANLLLAGAANILTTRSDTFVAHFRVRSFRQNPENGFWDATDPRYIVDERRIVMLIDRSNVDEPGDIADIVFLEDAPN